MCVCVYMCICVCVRVCVCRHFCRLLKGYEAPEDISKSLFLNSLTELLTCCFWVIRKSSGPPAEHLTALVTASIALTRTTTTTITSPRRASPSAVTVELGTRTTPQYACSFLSVLPPSLTSARRCPPSRARSLLLQSESPAAHWVTLKISTANSKGLPGTFTHWLS